ncbi:MAG: hypothetical protein AAGA61_04080, partial [Pseudomonadota bacterium]
MEGIVIQLALAAAGGLLVGAVAAWVVRGQKADRELEVAEDNWQRKHEQIKNQARVLTDQTTSLKVNLEATQQLALQNKHAAVSSSTELESVRERLRTLAQDLSAARAERDEFRSRMTRTQHVAVLSQKRVQEIATEFAKSRHFYKTQLGSAIEQRQGLERKIGDLKSEQGSLTTLLASAKAEHDSVNRMLGSARSRLEALDELEQKAISLEADNAELRHTVENVEREAAELKRDIREMEDLKSQNRELAHCLESMENSRKQYESDAVRYREQYVQSEKESETLRMKLGDIEENITRMQQEQEEAQEVTPIPKAGLATSAPAKGEGDDLTQIVGIGKVFEAMLHRLGIYYFRQIATFGPAELAKVNAELSEFKGRIEHDDWIGQAREL